MVAHHRQGASGSIIGIGGIYRRYMLQLFVYQSNHLCPISWCVQRCRRNGSLNRTVGGGDVTDVEECCADRDDSSKQ
jgi:hypothetical protein